MAIQTHSNFIDLPKISLVSIPNFFINPERKESMILFEIDPRGSVAIQESLNSMDLPKISLVFIS